MPAGNWEYKAALNDAWDENYGAARRRAAAPNIPLDLAAPARREVLLLARDALDRRQPQHGDRGGAGQLPERARLRRRLGPGLPALLAPGPGRRRRLHAADERACPPAATRSKVAINESWDENYGAGGAPGGAEHPVHRRRRLRARSIFQLRRGHARPDRRAAPAPPPQPASRHHRGQPAERARLPRRLAAGVRGHASRLRRRRRRLAGHVRPSPPGAGSTRRALNDGWDENYGANAHANGANIGR